MSVWNNIKRFNQGTQDWFKDVGLALVSGPKFVWDIATAPWNDREEFNGVTNTIRQASIDLGKNLGRPIGGAIAGIYHTNKNILWEPLTALALAGEKVSLSTQTPEEAKNAWKEAWENRQEVSLGQAYTELMPWSYGWKQYANLTGQKENLPLVLQDNFDIFDEQQRQKAFKESLYGGIMSGTLDFWKQFVLDVGLLGGAKVKEIRTPDDPREAIVGIDEALAGANNKYSKLGEDFAVNNDRWAEAHPWVRAGNNQGISSYLLGATSTKEEALYTMKALLGDKSAVNKLDALKRPDIAEPLKIASGEMTRSQLKILLREEKMLTGTTQDDMLDLSYLRTPEEIAADTEFLRAYAKHDKYIAALMGVAERPPVTEGIATTMSQRVGRELATARTAEQGTQAVDEPLLQVYQPTPFHRLYYKISHLGKERPSGIANLNDGDSIKEVTATANRLIALNLMTPERATSFMSQYAAAATPEAKLGVLESLEKAGFGAVGVKYDIPADLVESIVNNHMNLKNGFIREIRETGYAYDSIEDTNVKIALFESQTANNYPIADFDLIDSVIKRERKALGALYDAYGRSINTLEAVSDLWKASVLLRVGYPVRNAIDSQLRIMSVVGLATTLRHLGPGMKRLVENTYNRGERLVDNFDNYRQGIKQSSYGEIKSELQKAGAEITQHEAKIKKISAELQKTPDEPDLVAQLVAEKIKLDSKMSVYEANNQALTKLEKARIKGKKKTLGQEDVVLRSTFDSPDGMEFKVYGSFGGPLGDMWRQLNSSERVFSRILDDYADIYGSKFAATGTRGKVTPDMDNYYREWADGINKSFANAAVVKELIKPGADIQDVGRWLENSPAGIQVRTRLGLSREEALDYVTTVKGFVDWYMPPGSGIADELYKTGSVSEEFLRNAIKDPTKLPIVHGFILKENLGSRKDSLIKRFINRAFKVIGSMPEDAWARNPLFDELYRRSAQRRFETAEFLNKKRFTGEEFQDIAEQIEAGARADAMKGVREILYNVERRTNIAHAFRFISPFFSAQENAIKTWLKIVADKPYILNRAAIVWYGPNSAGLITDNEGDPVPPYTTLTGDEKIWIQVPPSIKKLPLIGPGLESLDQVSVSKRSLDVVFMGNPFTLSVGPYFALPASYIMKLRPELDSVLSWAFPYGPDASLGQFLPTWARRQLERAQGMDNSTYARMWTTIWLTEQQKSRELGLPYKTDKEIKQMTDALYNTRTWANLILPFAPQFNSPYRMHIERYREYSQQYGLEADAKFLEAYPEFFSFALSLSQNRTGVGSTMTDVRNIKRYSELISEIKDNNPGLIGLVTRGTDKAAFSATAYWWQEETAIGPGTSEKFRGAVDPKEALARNQAREGWVKFRKVQAYIDAALRQRKLISIDQAGAADLKALKDATIKRLASNIDPESGEPTGEPSAWYVDYRDLDGTKTARTVQGLRKIIQNDKFMEDNANNPTWKSVGVYLQMRDFVSLRLAARQSKDINAKENTDLKLLMLATSLRLKSEDIGFSDIYDRYLEQDRVYDKNLGVGK